MSLQIRKAQRKRAKMRLGLCAPSGGGKTLSALLIAMGLGDKVLLIDTEEGSGELYSDHELLPREYDYLPISTPYTVEKYLGAITAGEKAGYDVIVIDSLTHAWAGEGGLLDRKDAITRASASKNSYMAWRDVTPLHNQLINAMLVSPAHIVATMRTKTAYEIMEDGNGRKKPVKIGLAPVQRDGMEYEFTMVMDLNQENHLATVSKDRTGLFADRQPFVPTIAHGQEMLEWLNGGQSIESIVEPYRSLIEGFSTIGEMQQWRESNKDELRALGNEALLALAPIFEEHKRQLEANEQ